MKSIKYKTGGIISFVFLLCFSFVSCDFEYDLPEAGSKVDETLPSADFSYSQTDPDDFRIVSFANESGSSIDYLWEFENGDTSVVDNPSYTYPGEGEYTATLTSNDANGITSTVSKTIKVVEPDAPDAIVPEVLNGDFEAGQDDWKIANFTGGTTNPFNGSSDGSSVDYDGNDTGAKTGGAKWTMGTSAAHLLSNGSRFAYQAFTVSANTTYVFEWDHSIKNDVADVDGGDRLVVQIIDGHYDEGQDALLAGVISESVGTDALGKGNFTTLKVEFESNDSGEIAFWMWGVTAEDAYIDNVKLYPKG